MIELLPIIPSAAFTASHKCRQGRNLNRIRKKNLEGKGMKKVFGWLLFVG